MDSIAGELAVRFGVFAVALLVVLALVARPCLADTFTITWLDDAGETIGTTEVASGVVPSHAALPSKTENGLKFKFAGWMPEPVAATDDATYMASFEISFDDDAEPSASNVFTMTWLDYDGSIIDVTEVAAGETPTHAAVSREDTNGVRWRFTDAAASCGAKAAFARASRPRSGRLRRKREAGRKRPLRSTAKVAANRVDAAKVRVKVATDVRGVNAAVASSEDIVNLAAEDVVRLTFDVKVRNPPQKQYFFRVVPDE